MTLTTHNFAATRLLVVGDIILDRYWFGATSRISPEAPVPIVRIENTQELPGGAANVALNIAALGGSVTLMGCIGDDEAGKILIDYLTHHGVRCELLIKPQIKTITKLRVLSQHQQLLRVDFESDKPQLHEPDLIPRFEEQLGNTDVVVLSDYAKGTLLDIQQLIQFASQAHKKIVIDPKGTDFTRYRGATVITPNLKEFQAVVGDCIDDEMITQKARLLCQQLDISALLVTRGEQGMTLIFKDGTTHHLAARAREVFDVTGAGDTVIATMAIALASGYDAVQATSLANTAAGIVVGKLGAATVTPVELISALNDEIGEDVLLTEEALFHHVQSAKLRGETIVMTNGCFDILHPGHIRYLEEARRLGDRLVVAVNNDDSVTRLKGTGRPINSLPHRMAVLAGLKSVSWVVPFSEDTPERLICRILPDVLVKGGDYQIQQIAGCDCVLKSGGSVLALKYHAGFSSTQIIEATKKLKL